MEPDRAGRVHQRLPRHPGCVRGRRRRAAGGLHRGQTRGDAPAGHRAPASAGAGDRPRAGRQLAGAAGAPDRPRRGALALDRRRPGSTEWGRRGRRRDRGPSGGRRLRLSSPGRQDGRGPSSCTAWLPRPGFARRAGDPTESPDGCVISVAVRDPVPGTFRGLAPRAHRSPGSAPRGRRPAVVELPRRSPAGGAVGGCAPRGVATRWGQCHRESTRRVRSCTQ